MEEGALVTDPGGKNNTHKKKDSYLFLKGDFGSQVAS